MKSPFHKNLLGMSVATALSVPASYAAVLDVSHECNSYSSHGSELKMCVDEITEDKVKFKIRRVGNGAITGSNDTHRLSIRVGSPEIHSPEKAYLFIENRNTKTAYISMDRYFIDDLDNTKLFYAAMSTLGFQSGAVQLTERRSPEPDVSGLRSSYEVSVGQSITMEGTVRAGEGDILEVVTFGVQNSGGVNDTNTYRFNVNDNEFDLSQIEFAADQYPLNSAAVTNFAVYAKTREHSARELATGTIKVVTPAEPTISGLNSGYQVVAGNQFNLSGKVRAKSGDTIRKITIGVVNDGGVNDTSTYVYQPNSSEYNLANVQLDSGAYPINRANESTLVVWANTDYHTGVRLDETTVTVQPKEPESPTISGFDTSVTVPRGEHFELSGVVSADEGDTLDVVTISFTNSEKNINDTTTYRYTNVGRSFDISDIAINPDSWPLSEADEFEMHIWADSREHSALRLASGDLTLISNETTPAPQVSGFGSELQVTRGQQLNLSGEVRAAEGDRLEVVTIGIWNTSQNINDTSTYRFTPNSQTFDLSSVQLDSNQSPLTLADEFTLAIWTDTAETEAQQIATGSLTILAPPEGVTTPTLEGFESQYDVLAGDTFSLAGQLQIPAADNFEKLTIGLRTGGFDDISTYSFGQLTGQQINLSDFLLDTNVAPLSQSGVHKFSVWLDTANTDPTEMGTGFIYVHKNDNGQVEAINVTQTLEVFRGNRFKLGGQLVGNGARIERVGVRRVSSCDGAEKESFHYVLANGYDLSQIMVDTNEAPFGACGSYKLYITAEQNNNFRNVALVDVTLLNPSELDINPGLPYVDQFGVDDIYLSPGSPNKALTGKILSEQLMKDVNLEVTAMGDSSGWTIVRNSGSINTQVFPLEQFVLKRADLLSFGSDTLTAKITVKVDGQSDYILVDTFDIWLTEQDVYQIDDQKNIEWLVNNGIVNSAPDYRLTDTLKAAELAELLYRILGGGIQNARSFFDNLIDVSQPFFSGVSDPSSWYYHSVTTLGRLHYGSSYSVLSPVMEDVGVLAEVIPGKNITVEQFALSLLQAHNIWPGDVVSGMTTLQNMGVVIEQNHAEGITRSGAFDLLQQVLANNLLTAPQISEPDFVVARSVQLSGKRYEYLPNDNIETNNISINATIESESEEFVWYRFDVSSELTGNCVFEIDGGYIVGAEDNQAGEDCHIHWRAHKTLSAQQFNYRVEHYSQYGYLSELEQSLNISADTENNTTTPGLNANVSSRQVGDMVFINAAGVAQVITGTDHSITSIASVRLTVTSGVEILFSSDTFVNELGEFTFDLPIASVEQLADTLAINVNITVVTQTGAQASQDFEIPLNLEVLAPGNVRFVDNDFNSLTNLQVTIQFKNSDGQLVQQLQLDTDSLGEIVFNYPSGTQTTELIVANETFFIEGLVAFSQFVVAEDITDPLDGIETEEPGPEEPGPDEPDPDVPGPDEPDPDTPTPGDPDPGDPAPQEPVTINLELFQDAALARCVEEEMNTRNSDQISALTQLYCSGFGIETLNGIEQLQSLLSLGLTNNKIVDPGPIFQLQNLRFLQLGGNLIENLDGIGNTNIKVLYATESSLTNADDVANMEQLEFYSLALSQVTDFSHIAPLSKLTTLRVSSTGFGDGDMMYLADNAVLSEFQAAHTALSDLTNLPASVLHLTIPNTVVSDISSLADNPITALNVSGTVISDFSVVAQMTDLVHFSASDTVFNNPTLLENKNKLHSVTLLNTAIDHLQWISSLPALTNLHISGSDVTNLEPVRGKALQTLYVADLELDEASIEPLLSLAEPEKVTYIYFRNTWALCDGLNALHSTYLNANLIHNCADRPVDDMAPDDEISVLLEQASVNGENGFSPAPASENYERWAQTFTSDEDAIVSAFDLFLGKYGNEEDIQVSLFETENGLPTGESIWNSGIITYHHESPTWLRLNLSQEVNILADTTYSLVVMGGQKGGYWGESDRSTYDGGNQVVWLYGMWQDYSYSGKDFAFRIYKSEGEIPPPTVNLSLFKDNVLRLCVEKAMQTADSDEVAKITSVTCQNAGVADAEGIAQLTHLTYLDLSGNQIDDAKPIFQLERLEYLNINRNNIEILKGIANTNIKTLYANMYALKDAEEVAQLSELQFYSISNSSIKDFSHIASLSNLRTLKVSNTSFGNEDMVFLADNNTLFDFESIGTSLSDLQYLPDSVARINVHNSNVADISVLENNPVTVLSVGHTEIENFDVIAGFENLLYFDAQFTTFSDTSVLENNILLTHVNLEYTNVERLDWIDSVPNLEFLIVSGTKVSKIEALQGRSLTYIGIADLSLSETDSESLLSMAQPERERTIVFTDSWALCGAVDSLEATYPNAHLYHNCDEIEHPVDAPIFEPPQEPESLPVLEIMPKPAPELPLEPLPEKRR